MHGTQGLDNRWLVTVNCQEACDVLVQTGLHLFNRRIALRRYDDILADEYREYLEYLDLNRRMCIKSADPQQSADSIPDSDETTESRAATEDDREMLAEPITGMERREDTGVFEEMNVRGWVKLWI